MEVPGVCYFPSVFSMCLKYFKIKFLKEINLYELEEGRKEKQGEERKGRSVMVSSWKVTG